MSKFIREHRYYVAKVKDIREYLSSEDEILLINILSRLDHARTIHGKEPLECVVIESDWSEYEQVWKMIEERVIKE